LQLTPELSLDGPASPLFVVLDEDPPPKVSAVSRTRIMESSPNLLSKRIPPPEDDGFTP
jgi:hypothetical protein